MEASTVALLVLGVLVVGAGAQEPAPAPRLHSLVGTPPLDEVGRGEVLISELACVACHPTGRAHLQRYKQAPDLSRAGWRIAPDYLRRFIAAPGSTQPGTTMPDVLAGQPASVRGEIAEAITAYLMAASSEPFERGVTSQEAAERGRALFERVGCVACHAGDLDHVPSKYGLASLTDFLFRPLDVRPAGRMPDCRLSSEEARAIAAYLLAPTPTEEWAQTRRPELVDEGRLQFERQGCASCHPMEGIRAPGPRRGLESLDLERGCLSGQPALVPDFRLTDAQRAEIRRAIASPPWRDDDARALLRTLVSFDCLACHERGGEGVQDETLAQHFGTDEPELGDEARIPPPLTGVGAKLRLEWIQRVLFDAGGVRSYMHTRMPQFGESNLAHLPALFERVDRPLPVAAPEALEDSARKEVHDAGRILVGDGGLNCISCHDFGSLPSPGFGGLDLITTTERLRPEWFVSYLLAPRSFRPRTVMPDYWPDGVAVQTKILGGETRAQIDAIWHYLALGRSARDPAGIRAQPTELFVTSEARLYRGRSGIAGFRGIAVGFPGGLSYAFDAQNGALAGLWTGGFVRVNWRGQGPGNFDSATHAVQLVRDVAFRPFDEVPAPWPARPRPTEEQPVNQDPLYPRHLGYRFQGYTFDGEQVPTLRYRIGEVAIEDRSVPIAGRSQADAAAVLVRTLELRTPTARRLQFRALVGDIVALGEGEYSAPELRLRVPDVPARLRSASGDAPGDLLLDLDLPAGRSTLTLEYELSD